MMIEPQELYYSETEDPGPCITVYFPDHKQPVALPVKRVVETAFNALKSSNTEPGFYRKQCWEVLKCYLVSSLQPPQGETEKAQMIKLLSHPSFKEGPIPQVIKIDAKKT